MNWRKIKRRNLKTNIQRDNLRLFPFFLLHGRGDEREIRKHNNNKKHTPKREIEWESIRRHTIVTTHFTITLFFFCFSLFRRGILQIRWKDNTERMQRARITHKSQRLFFFFSSSDTHEIELPHVLLPLLLLLQFPPFFFFASFFPTQNGPDYFALPPYCVG